MHAAATDPDAPVRLAIASGCTADPCRAAADGAVWWHNTTQRPQDAFVAMSFEAAAVLRTASVEFRVTRVAADAACADAPRLSTPFEGDFGFEGRTPSDGTCDPPGTLVRFFRFTVPPRARLDAWVTPGVDATSAVGLALREDCAADTCLAVRPGVSGRGNALHWRNPGDTPREVRLSANTRVLSASRARAFLRVTAAPENPRACGTAPVLVPDAPPVTLSEPPDAVGPAACGRPAAYAWFFHLDVPAGRRIRVHADDATSSVGPRLQVLRDCATPDCLAQPSAPVGSTTHVEYESRGPNADRVLLVVYFEGDSGSPGVRLWATLDDPPPETQCSSAPVLGSGRCVATSEAVSEIPDCFGDATRPVPATFYRVTVPPGQALVTRSELDVAFRATCDAPRCLPGTQTRGRLHRWVNPGATDAEVRVAVSSPSAQTHCEITASVAPPIAAGRCTTAPELLPGVPRRDDPLMDAVDVVGGCDGGSAASLFYRLRVPPLSRVIARARAHHAGAPTLSADASLGLRTACDATTCVGSRGPYGRGWTYFDNLSYRPVSLVLNVSDTAYGEVDVTSEVAPFASNTRCESARTVGSGSYGGLSALDLPPAPARSSYEEAAESAFHFAVDVPAGATLLARTEALAVAVRRDCASRDFVGVSSNEARIPAAWYTNTGPGTARVIVLVFATASMAGAASDTLTLDVSPSLAGAFCGSAPWLQADLPDGPLRPWHQEERAPTCAGTLCPSLFRRIAIPPHTTLTVQALGAPADVLSLQLHDACGGAGVLARATGAQPATVTFTHSGDQPRTVLLAASSRSPEWWLTARTQGLR